MLFLIKINNGKIDVPYHGEQFRLKGTMMILMLLVMISGGNQYLLKRE